MARLVPIFFIVCTFFLFHAVAAFAHNCKKCHIENEVIIKIPPVPPIKVSVGGRERSITLVDAFKFHGHECCGVTTAFLAVQYGIKLLYGDSVPSTGDLLILSRHPSRGVMDLIDFVMKGENNADRTWPIAGMKKSRDNFRFTIIRKSACLAVDIQLNPARWPADFFKLKRKQKKKTLTKDEWETVHEYMKNIIMKFPITPAEELFGKPVPYKVLTWGTIEPSEIDRNIRKMRRSKKRKEKVSPKQ